MTEASTTLLVAEAMLGRSTTLEGTGTISLGGEEEATGTPEETLLQWRLVAIGS